MSAAGIPENRWSQALVAQFSNINDLMWWQQNRPDGEEWHVARGFFLQHFVHPNQSQHLIDELKCFQQRSGESMQGYSDRFQNTMRLAGQHDESSFLVGFFLS